jgi:hypothetical protein
MDMHTIMFQGENTHLGKISNRRRSKKPKTKQLLVPKLQSWRFQWGHDTQKMTRQQPNEFQNTKTTKLVYNNNTN